VNVAVTVVAAVMVTVQLPVPAHPPPGTTDQPENVDPTAGSEMSVTAVPALNALLHSVPPYLVQLMSKFIDGLIGFDRIESIPDVAAETTTTVNTYWFSVNVAVTVAAAVTVTAHVPVPVQPPPDHPVNDDPVAAVAVSVTTVP
jgi:hypothetical protein